MPTLYREEDNIDSKSTILFRLGISVYDYGICYHPIRLHRYLKPLEDSRKEMTENLPDRLEQELKEIEEFVEDRYKNSFFLKHDYDIYGPYKISYDVLDHSVEGYMYSMSKLSSKKLNPLMRGNIFLLESSPFVWRELKKNKILANSIKILSTKEYLEG